MKKNLFILWFLISLSAIPIHADKVEKKGDIKYSNTLICSKPHRKPAEKQTIEFIYDTDNRSIEVICSQDCEAITTIFDEVGNIVATSSVTDIITVPESINGNIKILVEANMWYCLVYMNI